MHSLYQQKIMDHYHFPRHKGSLPEGACLKSAQANPSCGDQITLYIMLTDGIIHDARFSGVGCILSLATADILLDYSKGKDIAQVVNLGCQDIQALVGITVGHTRIKCLMLSLQALQNVYA